MPDAARSTALAVLVTGGTGAIGRFVVDELLDRGHRVVALTRRDAQDLAHRPGLVWVTSGLDEVERIAELARSNGVERFVHLAAAILNSEGDLPNAVAANTLGAACIFEAARRSGAKRVVYASSKAVLGPLGGHYGHPEYRPVPEEHPRKPHSIYALTKCLSEDIAAFYRERYGLEIVSVRFGTSSGPGKGPQHAGAYMLSQIVEDPVRGKPVRIAQGGDQRDDITYTLEVANAIATICLAEGELSPVLHLDSGELVTLRDIAAIVREEIPSADIEVGGGLDYMGYGGIYGRLDGSRARRETGYEPRFDLRGWIRDYIARVRDADGKRN